MPLLQTQFIVVFGHMANITAFHDCQYPQVFKYIIASYGKPQTVVMRILAEVGWLLDGCFHTAVVVYILYRFMEFIRAVCGASAQLGML